MRNQLEIDAILRNVQDRLDAKRRNGGVALHVPTGGYAQNEDWLSVIVEPDAAGMRAYQYVDALGDVERELRTDGIEKLVLVPAIAD